MDPWCSPIPPNFGVTDDPARTALDVDSIVFLAWHRNHPKTSSECGQGDCTVVLAGAVGEHGRVTAVGSGALDYGSPTILGKTSTRTRGRLAHACLRESRSAHAPPFHPLLHPFRGWTLYDIGLLALYLVLFLTRHTVRGALRPPNSSERRIECTSQSTR
ncbi:hypothetical protein M0805_005609 [Coniferiporia weirii]|nr:hypothetical protein M0805_005609 [Coniferiporia weirii]